MYKRQDATTEQLLEVNDVGPIVAGSLRTFFEQAHNREVVEQLRACGVHWPEQEPVRAPALPLAVLMCVAAAALALRSTGNDDGGTRNRVDR